MPPYKNTECSQIPTCKEHCYVAISDPFNTYMGPILEQISEIRTSYLPPSNSLTIGTADCCELEKWCLRLFSLSCFFFYFGSVQPSPNIRKPKTLLLDAFLPIVKASTKPTSSALEAKAYPVLIFLFISVTSFPFFPKSQSNY